jgi:hypothetical protein
LSAGFSGENELWYLFHEKNAHKKLIEATTDIDWAMRTGKTFSESNLNKANSITRMYTFFL